eukprot:366480-Chlamydomonas_euryale.AAC.4
MPRAPRAFFSRCPTAQHAQPSTRLAPGRLHTEDRPATRRWRCTPACTPSCRGLFPSSSMNHMP